MENDEFGPEKKIDSNTSFDMIILKLWLLKDV